MLWSMQAFEVFLLLQRLEEHEEGLEARFFGYKLHKKHALKSSLLRVKNGPAGPFLRLIWCIQNKSC